MMKNSRSFFFISVVLLGSGVSSLVMADPNPYYLGAAQSFGHDSNLFRVANGQPEISDNIYITSLLAGINQPFSRQRFYADGALNAIRYRDNDQLNNTGYNLLLGLDLETVERLSGSLSYRTNRSLADFGAAQGPGSTKKNEETSRDFLATVRYGQLSLLSLEGSFAHRQLDYSESSSNYLELKQNTGTIGIKYRPGGALTIGVGVRHTKGEYPYAVQTGPDSFQSDEFNRNDFDLTAAWVLTGLSTLRARLSQTNESHNVIKSRDVSGPTGSLGWDYKPTAKLSFIAELVRDTGSEAAFYQPGSGQNSLTGSSQLSKIAQVKALYDATAKIQLQADALYIKRDLVSTFALVSGGQSIEDGSDRYTRFGLGINYSPTRNWLVACSVAREKRNSSSNISYPYDANTANCSVRFKLQ